MTFSIVARCASDGSFGVAAASKFLAVGARLPMVEADVGAVATQADANLSFREEGIGLLRSGSGAEQTLGDLIRGDPDRDIRQVGIVDAFGAAANWTGGACRPYAGALFGENVSIQGNRLRGPAVIKAMMKMWELTDDSQPLGSRLVKVLLAGEDAGGDRRGKQSSVLMVAKRGAGVFGSDIEIDLRVDDSTEPVAELGRLLELHFGLSKK